MPGDLVDDYLLKFRYGRSLDKAKSEEKKKVKMMDEAKMRTFNRRDLEKHLKMPYKRAFIELLWYDEVVRRRSKEYGVEAIVWIENSPRFEWNIFIISKFNGKEMDDEKRFEEIKRRVEALLVAYKLAATGRNTGRNTQSSEKPYWRNMCQRKKRRRGKPLHR